MENNHKQPLFIDHVKGTADPENEIKRLLDSEHFAVLSTRYAEGIHSSLISYAVYDNYKALLFATPYNTKKYKHICGDPCVSLLIDNRASIFDDINKISAITATGSAYKVEEKERICLYKNLLLSKHTYLKSFLFSKTTAIIKVNIIHYQLVSNFQEVREWRAD